MHRCKHIYNSHKPTHRPKIAKELPPLPPREEFQNFSPTLLKKIKTRNRTDQHDMTVKLNKDNGLQTRWTRTPAGNSVYVAIAGEVVNRRSVLLRNIVLNGQESASNPLLHIHAKRYLQAAFTSTGV